MNKAVVWILSIITILCIAAIIVILIMNKEQNNNTPHSNTGTVSASTKIASEIDMENAALEAFDLINDIRKENGLKPYKWGGTSVSDVRAVEIQTNFSHDSASNQKYSCENVGKTNTLNPSYVVKLWMESPDHKVNILESRCMYAQMSVTYKDGMYYWANEFYDEKGFEMIRNQKDKKANDTVI